MNIPQMQLFRILQLHYIDQVSQKEIAEREGLSRATVSRAVKEGIDAGYVKISINLPHVKVPELEAEIREKYGLDHVSVSKVLVQNSESIARDVAWSFSDFFNEKVKQDEIVGLSWGRTLSRISQHMRPEKKEKLLFVNLNGGVSRGASDTNPERVLYKFSQAYGASSVYLPLPVMTDSQKILDALMTDKEIERIFSIIQKAETAVFSVGEIAPTSLLYEGYYYTEETCRELLKKGYVGDICSRLYKLDGSYKEEDFENRTIGISLEDLKKKKRKICIVMDPRKTLALEGALRGGYIDCLFLDELTAMDLLKKAE